MASPLQKLLDYNLDRWLPGYVREVARRTVRRERPQGARHLLVAVCDHHEPFHGGRDEDRGNARMKAWHEGYPALASQFRDADGRHPRHSFFFPGDEYKPYFLDSLADLAKRGFGEVEVHLHHDGDTRATLREKFEQALRDFAQHGHISRAADGGFRWAFIHGNWALANARKDGRWCGVDDELLLLWELGCYADFTFPSAPDECQPNIVNQIYWPTGDLGAKRCYEHGVRARVGDPKRDRLLMVTGPVALAKRPGKLSGRIEGSHLTAVDPPTPARVKTWTRQNIHIEGRPDWVFLKLHTHGSPEKQAASLLGEEGRAFHRHLAERYNDGADWVLHYVTAREMFNIALAAMDGKTGNPFDYRDHVIAPPPAAS